VERGEAGFMDFPPSTLCHFHDLPLDAASSLREPHRPEPQGLDFELSNLYITKEDLVEVFCNKFKAEILEA
jgi:hypothetical protein